MVRLEGYRFPVPLGSIIGHGTTINTSSPHSREPFGAANESGNTELERRISDLTSIDVETTRERGEPRFSALAQKIDDTLIEIFGGDTIEYRRYQVSSLDTASVNFLHGTPLSEVIEGYKRGIDQAISKLQTAIDLLKEKLQDLGETSDGRAVRAFGELDIHPEIARAVAKLFRDGHYANAVEDACKVLDSLVKMRSGKFELSGTDLMQQVFSPNGPILRFNDLTTETGKSEQKGMMFLCSGAMLALRNPRAHELIEDDPEQALEYIGFLSLLAKLLDRTERI
jgi:uncharacterized protein (TIGR02391 family)